MELNPLFISSQGFSPGLITYLEDLELFGRVGRGLFEDGRFRRCAK